MRLLGLDIGAKTIGCAVTDPTGLISRPVRTLRRTGLRADLQDLERLVAELGAEGIVVGFPLHVSGQAGEAVERVRKIARKLSGRLGVHILGVDERYTSLEAADLDRQRSGKARRRGDDHALAAALILERYLREGEQVVLERW